jgi:hypothetical protein
MPMEQVYSPMVINYHTTYTQVYIYIIIYTYTHPDKKESKKNMFQTFRSSSWWSLSNRPVLETGQHLVPQPRAHVASQRSWWLGWDTKCRKVWGEWWGHDGKMMGKWMGNGWNILEINYLFEDVRYNLPCNQSFSAKDMFRLYREYMQI